MEISETSTVLNFPVKTVRTTTSPSNPNVTTYYVWVAFNDLPEGMSLEVNPRKPKMNTAVAKQLIAAVVEIDSNFDINNRGIVIRANQFKYHTTKDSVTLDLGNDEKKYGIVDGGHTYTAIIDNRIDVPEGVKKYVKLEILVGEDLNVAALADARNTSAQVSDIALFELDDKFDFVKDALRNEPYFKEIAYKDNENKRLPIVEFIKLMFAFNIKRYPNDSSAPVSTYSSKAAVFKDYQKEYKEQENIYLKLSKQLPTLIKLYEQIQLDMPNKYIEYKSEVGQKGKFGQLSGAEVPNKNNKNKLKTLFTQKHMEYGISIGYILPIFGAFRALLEEKENDLEWAFDPLKVWEKASVRLIQNTFDTETNPQLAGKNKTLWQSNYRIVDSIKKDLLLEYFMKKNS